MKIVAFATAASASLVASMTVLVASSAPVPAAAAAAEVAPGLLPGPKKKKVCTMKIMMAKDNCVVVSKPPTKKPAKKAPSRRPTRFPTSRPLDNGPTASPSGSPTKSLTAGCPDFGVPALPYGGHVYAFVHHAFFSWDQANEAAGSLTCCRAQGRLLVVGDAPERDFITAAFDVKFHMAWIGLTDVDEEGTYVWTDGTTLDPSLFAPVAYHGTEESSDHCFFYDNPNLPAKWYALDSVEYALDSSVVEFDCSTTAGEQ
jgi:Lectin C-type domain